MPLLPKAVTRYLQWFGNTQNMANEMIFFPNSLFENVSFGSDSDSWVFSFADNINVTSSGFWRLLENRKISLVSLDNGHQFGLPKPLDLVEELNTALAGQLLTKIEVVEETFDLKLTFNALLELEVFIASAGYETYSFLIGGKTYIGMGSGDISIMDNF